MRASGQADAKPGAGVTVIPVELDADHEPLLANLSDVRQRGDGLEVVYTLTPERTEVFGDFMYRTGLVAKKPSSWKDLFFGNVHGMPGS